MTIENLLRAVPAPRDPGDTFEGPWARVEAELRTSLPQDYKDFVRLFGFGYFMEFLGVDVPRSRNPNIRLELQARLACDAIRKTGDVTQALWPEPAGLLPFGGTDNGDTLLWSTHGRPDEWRVAILCRASLGEIEFLDVDLTDFLAGLATGDIRPESFPDLLPCDRLFTSYPTSPDPVVEITWRLGTFGRGPGGRSRLRLDRRA